MNPFGVRRPIPDDRSSGRSSIAAPSYLSEATPRTIRPARCVALRQAKSPKHDCLKLTGQCGRYYRILFGIVATRAQAPDCCGSRSVRAPQTEAGYGQSQACKKCTRHDRQGQSHRSECVRSECRDPGPIPQGTAEPRFATAAPISMRWRCALMTFLCPAAWPKPNCLERKGEC